ncbi:efflux RND transporter periplasmic adaptor subunit [Aliikangiella sp. IMCC44359]|uniref:efflux RND transporter periplasmic adaptor subunit n=1 Tax=Aliikangiella sp. IMCC44359 TaxID=3459125 RepID=UPI00403B272B
MLFANSALADDDEDNDDIREDGKIALSEEQIKFSGIELSQAQAAKIRDSLPAYGLVVTNTNHEQEIVARFEGVIRQVSKKLGDTVKKGELLISIEANDSLKIYPINSELDGVITFRDANIGEQTSDDLLLKVENFSTVWVDLSIFPKDLSKIHLDQRVRIKSADAESFTEGPIIFIAPFGDPSNQSITTRVLVDNSDGKWKPGHFVDSEVILSESVASLTVENEAIQIINELPVVFVKEGPLFEPRNIKLGRSDSELSEVLSGLDTGETYVSKNSFVLKSELGKGDIEDDD